MVKVFKLGDSMFVARFGCLLCSLAFIVFAVALPQQALAGLRDDYVWFGALLKLFEQISMTGEPVHVVLFAGLALVARLAFPSVTMTKLAVYLVLFAVCSELIQYFAPGRQMGFNDLVANLAGLSIGFVIAALCMGRFNMSIYSRSPSLR